MQSVLTSLIIPLLLSFIPLLYSFLPYSSFSIIQDFALATILSIILFFTSDITFSFTSFSHAFLLVLSISVSKVLAICCSFCRKCCCNSFLFFYHILDFCLFVVMLCVMIQSILHIVFSVLQAIVLFPSICLSMLYRQLL